MGANCSPELLVFIHQTMQPHIRDAYRVNIQYQISNHDSSSNKTNEMQ